MENGNERQKRDSCLSCRYRLWLNGQYCAGAAVLGSEWEIMSWLFIGVIKEHLSRNHCTSFLGRSTGCTLFVLEGSLIALTTHCSPRRLLKSHTVTQTGNNENGCENSPTVFFSFFLVLSQNCEAAGKNKDACWSFEGWRKSFYKHNGLRAALSLCSHQQSE